jgi:DNA repair protein RecO (recombination protein O)
MPLYTADALVLRTYKLAEADRIVVFLTRDRGKKRGVAPHARRPRSRFTGALEPLTEVRVAYFEKERRELVSLNYAETIRSPLAAANPESLAYSHYFAELIDAWAADADAEFLTSLLHKIQRHTTQLRLSSQFGCQICGTNFV